MDNFAFLLFRISESDRKGYQQIESLWQQLTQSYKALKVGEDTTLDEGIAD
jgi:hypothetical protein